MASVFTCHDRWLRASRPVTGRQRSPDLGDVDVTLRIGTLVETGCASVANQPIVWRYADAQATASVPSLGYSDEGAWA